MQHSPRSACVGGERAQAGKVKRGADANVTASKAAMSCAATSLGWPCCPGGTGPAMGQVTRRAASEGLTLRTCVTFSPLASEHVLPRT